MLKKIKLNVLIPIQYNRRMFIRTMEEYPPPSKNEIKDSLNDSSVWFHYFFKNLPIENNNQMRDSFLRNEGAYLMSRVKLNNEAREMIGLHKSTRFTYTLNRKDIPFNIGDIRILFTQSGIAFFHFDITADNLEENKSLIFINAFSHIYDKEPRLTYEKRIWPENTTETVEISLKKILNSLLEFQKYIPLSKYNDRYIPYIQVGLIGHTPAEDRLKFFDSIRAHDRNFSISDISEQNMYCGRQSYVSRFTGDTISCVYGDTEECGEENLGFIADSTGGLLKSVAENYTSSYAYLITLKLLSEKPDLDEVCFDYVTNASPHMTGEENISGFFSKCLWKSGWNLSKKTKEVKRKGAISSRETNNVDLFISYHSEDALLAEELFDYVNSLGFTPFLSQVSLLENGNTDYVDEIMDALDAAENFALVASGKTCNGTYSSKWVKFECHLFINEKASGRKNGNMFTILGNGIKPEQLPVPFRDLEVIPSEHMDKVKQYIIVSNQDTNINEIKTISK